MIRSTAPSRGDMAVLRGREAGNGARTTDGGRIPSDRYKDAREECSSAFKLMAP